MRIRIVLNLDNQVIPVNYREKLVGIIYNLLPHDENTTILHDDGLKLENKKYKLFTFSEIYGNTTYLKETKELKFTGNACFDITSFDDKLLYSIVDYIDNNNTILFGNKIIEVVKYDILDDSKDKSTTITYYTLSPITIYNTFDNYTKFYSPDNPEFKELIIRNISNKYYLCYHENMPSINIEPIDNVKRKIIKFRGVVYETYHLNITISNVTSKIHNVIMSCGIGPKNALGFGMVSIRR